MFLQVHVNGVQLCIFKHRIPLENISTLAIFGDISITIYGFIEVKLSWLFLIFILLDKNISDQTVSLKIMFHVLIPIRTGVDHFYVWTN